MAGKKDMPKKRSLHTEELSRKKDSMKEARKIFLVPTKGLTSYDIVILEGIGVALTPEELELIKEIIRYSNCPYIYEPYVSNQEWLNSKQALLKKLEAIE